MMLIENEFWNAVIVLFCLCAVLSAIIRGIYFHIMSGQVGRSEEEEYRDKGNRSCSMGCAIGALFLFFNAGGLLALSEPFLFGNKKAEARRQKQEDAVAINPLTQGPISILAKEKPLLFEHYCELGRVSDSLDTLRKEEESARAGMRNREARDKLSKSIASHKASMKRYAELRKNVETQAGYLYFARLFSNLGRRFNDTELLDELNRTEQALKQELLNQTIK